MDVIEQRPRFPAQANKESLLSVDDQLQRINAHLLSISDHLHRISKHLQSFKEECLPKLLCNHLAWHPDPYKSKVAETRIHSTSCASTRYRLSYPTAEPSPIHLYIVIWIHGLKEIVHVPSNNCYLLEMLPWFTAWKTVCCAIARGHWRRVLQW